MISRLSDIITGRKVFLFGEESYIRRLQSLPGIDLSFISGVITEEDLSILKTDYSCVIAVIARLPQKYIRILKSKGVLCQIITNRFFGFPESRFENLEVIKNLGGKSSMADISCALNTNLKIKDLGYAYNDAGRKFKLSVGFNSGFKISGSTIEEGSRIFVGSNSSVHIGPGAYIGANTEIIIGSRCDVRIGKNILLSENTVVNLADCCDLSIGDNTTAGPFLECYAYSPIHIGKDCMLSSNIYIDSGDGHDIRLGTKKNYPEEISIGDHTWIGKNVSVLKGTSIFKNSIIGVGTIVKNRKTAEPMIIYGNPNMFKTGPFSWDRRFTHYLEIRGEFKKKQCKS